MVSLVVTSDDGIMVLPASPKTGGTALMSPQVESDYDWSGITAKVIVDPDVVAATAFKLPDFYNYFPQIIRQMDTNLVDRGPVPVYAWDSIPVWDTEPFTWDEVIGPEPILKSTTRVMQLELEKSCQEIDRLVNLFNVDEAHREFLPHLAAGLGTPLPSSKESSQRAFLRNLVQTYRNKGTPLSFFRLFESLGFRMTLSENYQRKADAAFVSGPQMKLVSSNLTRGESLGTTIDGQILYRFQLMDLPIIRGSAKIQVYDNSTDEPTLIIDNADGGWSDGTPGFINYETGTIEFTLSGPPALVGQPIEVDYRFFPDQFPDPLGDRFANRYRSSVVSVALTPKDASVNLTPEVNDRLLLYLDLLKPAHIIIKSLDIIFNFQDDENVNLDDDLDPRFTYIFPESLFGTLYLGYGWAVQNNGSINPNPVFGGNHRNGPEYLSKYSPFLDDETRVDPNFPPPYHYPFLMNGAFAQPHAGGAGTTPGDNYEADWVEDNEVFDTTVSNDSPQSDTAFSIVLGAGTMLGVGDHLVINDGPNGGTSSIIQTFTDNGTYYDVVVSPAFLTAPDVGDSVTLLDIDGVNMQNLESGFREQDPVDLIFGEALSPAPDGISTGPFTITIDASHLPVAAGSTSYLRFTIGSTDYEETATGTGAFTNVSGEISVSSIDYTTGAVSVTFNNPPDGGSIVQVLSGIAASLGLGAY